MLLIIDVIREMIAYSIIMAYEFGKGCQHTYPSTMNHDWQNVFCNILLKLVLGTIVRELM